MFEYRFDLGMSSVDAAGVLFFPELFRHAHDAYEAFMADNGIALHDLLAGGRHALPIVHAEADYGRPLRHGTSITVTLAVSRLGERSFTVAYAFLDGEGQRCATAETVHALIDITTGKASPLPGDWRERLGRYLAPAT